jgi:hypothetical protein
MEGDHVKARPMLAVLFVNGDLQLALDRKSLAGLEPQQLGRAASSKATAFAHKVSPWLSDRMNAVTKALPDFAVRLIGSRYKVPVTKAWALIPPSTDCSQDGMNPLIEAVLFEPIG